MTQYTGEIAFLDARDVKIKNGRNAGKTLQAYNIKLKLENGELSPRIDAGFGKPEFDKGSYVTITTKQDGQYEKIDSIVAASRPAVQTAGRAPVSAAAGDGGSDGADRQTQIVLQHSQEMAVREVALLLTHNALPLSKAESKGGQAKRYEEIVKAVEKLTVQRYFDVVSGRLLDTVADAGQVDVSADGQLPAASENSTTTDTSEDD